ncbi:MAG: gliding motility-associated C-terminal domain-containing protein [Sphingobacteriales bacterium]|nr:gliding motility-associated C-terminal domain-containing protein [Sphingobacteriales bacterium]
MVAARRIILLVFILSVVSIKDFAQVKGCADSLSSYILSGVSSFPTGEMGYPVTSGTDNEKNYYFPFSLNEPNKPNLIKLDKDYKIVWAKRYPLTKYSGFGLSEQFSGLHVLNEDNVILSGHALQPPANGPCKILSLISINASGNMNWKKFYFTDGYNPIVLGDVVGKGKNNDILVSNKLLYGSCFPTVEDNSYNISLLDDTGNIKWAKKIEVGGLGLFHKKYEPENNLTYGNNSVYFLGHFYYGAETFNYWPKGKDGFFISRLNYENGDIIQYKFFQFNISGKTIHFNAKQINYDTTRNEILIVAQADPVDINEHESKNLLVVVDKELNIKKAVIINLPIQSDVNPVWQQVFSKPDNTLLFSSGSQLEKSLIYTIVDNNQTIKKRRVIKISDIVPFQNSFTWDAITDPDNSLRLRININGSNSLNKIVLINTTALYNRENSCIGYELGNGTVNPINITEVKAQLFGKGNIPILVANQAVTDPENLMFSTTEVCKEKIVCDTIKLHAPDTVCNTNYPIIITAYKNPLCIGKVNFVFDTTEVKSFIQTNDTTLQLTFDKSYKGKIYAQPSTCNLLKDSVEIKVVAPAQRINLGKDTLYCPNSRYMLNAYNPSFINYHWQNNSTDSVFEATTAGRYFVTAKDYCNREYADTINIIQTDMFLKIEKDTVICKSEPVILEATEGFLNYNWLPSTNLTLVAVNKAEVQPGVSTKYSVTAEKFPGCFLKDTVTITVKDCPQSIYIPNTFTPNNDGRNDLFKPIISGRLKLYEFAVYNRWGEPVFKSQNFRQAWDGKTRGGIVAGTYVWVCKYQFQSQGLVIKKGTVTLLK